MLAAMARVMSPAEAPATVGSRPAKVFLGAGASGWPGHDAGVAGQRTRTPVTG